MSYKFLAVLIVMMVLTSAMVISMATSPVIGQEEAPSMDRLAREIRAGKIDVGDEYGMEPEQRFHVIHADTLGMKCTQCHVDEAPYEVAVPYSDEADPVDRRVCLGCHVNGPGTPLYEPQE